MPELLPQNDNDELSYDEIYERMSLEDRLWTESYSTQPEYARTYEQSYDLEELLISPERSPHPVYILWPGREFADSLNNYNHFSSTAGYFRRDIIEDRFLEKTKDKLSGKQYHRDAKLEIDQDRTARIQLGIRRSPFHIPENEIAKAVYYFGLVSEDYDYEWTYHYYNKQAYPGLIRPYVETETPGTTHPINWACHRTQIAAGFAYSFGMLHDCPPSYLASPMKRIAKTVCNTVPEEMLEPREYTLNNHSKQLLATTKSLTEDNFCPETACFILEVADSLTTKMLIEAETVTLLEQIPKLLENGLIIDRLTALFHQCVKQQMPEAQALKTALQTVASVYGREKNPWWFKEDIDFTKTDHPVELLAQLATASGPAFEYTLELYEAEGARLVESGTLTQAQSLHLCATVSEMYGVGNLERARSVIKFAESTLNGVREHEIPDIIDLFLEHITTQRTRCEVISKMQGAEAIIDFPGLVGLMASSRAQLPEGSPPIDNITITPDHIRTLIKPLSQPLGERAKKLPPTRTRVRETLLTPRLQTTNLLPQTTTSATQLAHTPNAETSLLHQVLAFYKKLRAECAYTDKDVADKYFAFCAQKMPDPLNPPDGFLQFLQRWNQLPVKGYDLPYFYSPEQRAGARERNAEAITNKQAQVINLLDAWVMGIFSEEDLIKIINWMTEDAPANKRAEIAKQVCQQAKGYKIYGDESDEDPEVRAARDEEDKRFKVEYDIRRYEVETWQKRAKVVAVIFKRIVAVLHIGEKGLIHAKDAQKFIDAQIAQLRSGQETLPDAVEASLARFSVSVQELTQTRIIDGDELHERIAADGKVTPELMAALFAVIERYGATSEMLEQKENEKDTKHELLRRKLTDINTLWSKLPQSCIDTLGDILAEDALERIMQNFTKFQIAMAIAQEKTEEERNNQPLTRDKQSNVRSITELTVNLISSLGALSAANHKLLPSAHPEHSKPQIEHTVSAFKNSVATLIPQIRKTIEHARRKALGLVPVGGKIHVMHPIDEERFAQFIKAFDIQQTSFRLIHANTSMLLPPTPSSEELSSIISSMETLQIIDRELPELQMSIPGRLPPQDCALLGSAILLATESGKEEYPKDAFCTTHNTETGARMMAYDAREPNINMPFMPPLEGRTDMLGRRSLSDLSLYQRLGSILIQRHTDQGPFEHLADQFEKKYRAILQNHNLVDIINDTWVYKPGDDRSDNEASEEHYLTVKKCTDAYRKCAKQFHSSGKEEGIIFEVRELFDWIEENISKIQKTIYDPSNPCCDTKLLLNS